MRSAFRSTPKPLGCEDREHGEDRVAGDAPLADRVDHRDLDHDQVDPEGEAGEDDRRTDRGRLDPRRERRQEHGDVGDEPEHGDGDPRRLRVSRVLHGLAAACRAHEARARVAGVDEVAGHGGPREREHRDRNPQLAVGHRRSASKVCWNGPVVSGLRLMWLRV